MIKALTKDSTHVPSHAFPLSIDHISKIVAYLDKGRNVPPCIKPCILIGFSCFLRASNLIDNNNFGVIDNCHTLLARHIVDCGSYLRVHIMTTKTRRLPYTLCVPLCELSQICPVRAWKEYKLVREPRSDGPAFVLNNGQSLTGALIVRLMRDALSDDETIPVLQISMHSLRRGAVQQAAKAGSSNDDIMLRGAWASESGLKPYLAQ